MSTTQTENERLQQYFDGELAVPERAEVRDEIAASDGAARTVAKLEQLRTLLRSASTEWSGALDSDALFARIEQSAVSGGDTNAQPHETRPALKVIRGGSEKPIWGGVAIGLAAAAAVFLAVFALPANDSPEHTRARHAAPQIAGAHLGSEVLEVDFGANTGTVFAVKGSSGQPLAVVWIDDGEVGVP